jgi:hypothetical protein
MQLFADAIVHDLWIFVKKSSAVVQGIVKKIN